MKLAGFLAAFLAVAGVAADTPTVTAATARQRYPWNGLVDITVTLTGKSNDVVQSSCVFAVTNCATHAALKMTHVTGSGTMVGAGTTWTRRYVWDATADVGEVKIDDVKINVEAKMLGGVQLWENGPYWAECNVGASKPEEYGYYFWWGDTVGYTREGGTWEEDYEEWEDVTWVSSTGTRMESSPFDWDDCPTMKKDDATLLDLRYIDKTGNLAAAHDAATVHLGAPWRVPTDADFEALMNNCDWLWTMRNGVYGWLVTGRGTFAAKSIFLPAAGYGDGSGLYGPGSDGYCWSSSPYSDISNDAWDLYFNSGYFGRSYYDRCYGRSVRPLRGFAQ